MCCPSFQWKAEAIHLFEYRRKALFSLLSNSSQANGGKVCERTDYMIKTGFIIKNMNKIAA